MSWRHEQRLVDYISAPDIVGSNFATSYHIVFPVLGACKGQHIVACIVGGTVGTADLDAVAALVAEDPEHMECAVQHIFACNDVGIAGTDLVVVAAAVAGSRPCMVQHICSCTVHTGFPAVVAASDAKAVAAAGCETD